MLKQILNFDFSVNEVMIGIAILLGILIFIKFVITVIRNKSFRDRSNEPVYKNLIKRPNKV